MFIDDFYPTPNTLIQKMIWKLTEKERQNIKTILDPSVWKWDIIKYIKENIFKYNKNNCYDFSYHNKNY